MKTVDELMAEAFSMPRTPRSPEYQAGVRATLEWFVDKVKPFNPYPLGTAAADAHFAGQREGYDIFRRGRAE